MKKRKYGNCKDCKKLLGDYYSIRCKTCSNKQISANKIGTHLVKKVREKISAGMKLYAQKNPSNLNFQKGHKINLGRVYSQERNNNISGVDRNLQKENI